MSDISGPTVGEVFGANLRQAREKRGWSQSELARRMRDESLWKKYSQMGVSRTEDNLRAVRLDEAVALANVLGCPIEDLLRGEPMRRELVRIDLSTRILRDDWEAAGEKMGHLLVSRDGLEHELTQLPDDMGRKGRSGQVLEHAQAALEECTAYAVIRAGVLHLVRELEADSPEAVTEWLDENGGLDSVVARVTDLWSDFYRVNLEKQIPQRGADG
ncbi:helix-turn-helix domain-containing protein [Kocuria rhizophila]|uniref:helix-turn-helix domain-containing protein n=1 Tax=Kocuria rhizophila TaxID=72000 RepID=UPI002ED1BDD1|nr:helix-turn-helix transcriptional regulator [Kocuria rhizophila]